MTDRRVEVGTKFEKTVQYLLRKNGIRAHRNIEYRKSGKPKQRQIDLDYMVWDVSPLKLKVRSHVVGECKYKSGKLDIYPAIEQLLFNVVYVGADYGALFTNNRLDSKKHRIERECKIKIYDWNDLQQLYVNAGGKKTWMEVFRKTKAKGNKKIVRYV